MRDARVTNLILLNTANILYIFCYGVRDVLWLRILAVAAMILLLPYYARQPEPMTDCMIWQFFFIAINVYWIIRIFRERRPPAMSPDQQRLYDTVFKGCCSPYDMLRLIEKANWIEATNGDNIVQRNSVLDKLLLIQDGVVSVQVDGREVAMLGQGNLIGEMSFMTRNKTVADVVADGSVRYLAWHRDVLEALFETKVELKSAIHEVIGRDLVHKLTSQNPQPDLTDSISA